MARVIFHIDLDAFFVAVERIKDPSLDGKPVIVGGLGPRGVVATASYEARKYGVHSAMAMAQARRLCPQAIYLPADFDSYARVSRRFRAVLDSFSPVVEQTSVDEAYVDMTGTERLFGPPEEAARKLKVHVRNEAKVVGSVGIATNKLVAKVASDASKPDGLLIVPPGGEAAYFAPLPVRKLPGVGPRTEAELKRVGVITVGQLASCDIHMLRRILGDNSAQWLKQRAAGIDVSPVETGSEARSISSETTFTEDITGERSLSPMLLQLTESVGARLRRQGKCGDVVQIKLRYNDFSTISRQATLAMPTDDDVVIGSAAKRLLSAALAQRSDPVRLLGVGVSGLRNGLENTQMALLPQANAPAEGNANVNSTIDAIRQRYGRDAVRRAASPGPANFNVRKPPAL